MSGHGSPCEIVRPPASTGRLEPRYDTQVLSEAERNAAKSLGIEPVAVYELACRPWDHGLDDERESRWDFSAVC